jgi:hypothetical protein
MTLRISGLKNPEKFVTPHHVHTKTGDGKELIILTGVVIIDLKGESGEQWRWETVDFGIPFRHLHPDGKALAPENWAVFVTINAIYNAGKSYNSGHAVDAFELLGARAGLAQEIWVRAHVAVRDSDAYLFRIGYHVTLVGKFFPVGRTT